MTSRAYIARQNGKLGGRPAGSATRLSRGLANEIVRQGFHPIGVMMENLAFWHEGVEEIKEVIRELMKRPRTVVERERLIALLEVYAQNREKSEGCAKDLAPYIHPKLANITVTPDDTDTRPLGVLPDDALQELAALGMTLVARRKALAAPKAEEDEPDTAEG